MSLLKLQAKYDVDHALVLCKMYKFEQGVVFLYEKLKLFNEIVQHYMEAKQHGRIIKACKKYGGSDPDLWVQALSYFANEKDMCEKEIGQVLDNIDRHNLLPPLRVVQILSRNPDKQLSVVKDYIIKSLEQENGIIIADQAEIQQYQEQTHTMREEIEQLKTRPTTFQGTKCHACTNGLSLPAIHFLCMHSFHERCVVESDRQCPKCAPEFRKVMGKKEAMKQSASQHDPFFKKLDASKDGFATVAEYFGSGIFDKLEKKEKREEKDK